MLRKLLLLVVILLIEGCGANRKQVPSTDVFGSYFPAWLISLAAGVVLTIVAGAIGRLIQVRPGGFAGFILSISLILIFSITVWFWFFAS
jgi:YtcA family